MTDTNVIKLAQPGMFSDPLTEVLRDGARALYELPKGTLRGTAALPDEEYYDAARPHGQ